MHPILLSTEGVSILKTLHCLISIFEPTIESLPCFEEIILFVFCRKGNFLIRLFVVSVGNDIGEELEGLLGKLRIMYLSSERPTLQTLISGPMFSDIVSEFFKPSLLRGRIPF